MLEFLIALLVFSVGMMGLLSAQLAGKRASYEAIQRSVATALARDIIERMRANPGQLTAYKVDGAGGENSQQPPPAVNCDQSECTAAQLAAFDVWQWESLLLGVSEQDAGGSVGGLADPLACVTIDGREVDVVISWLGLGISGPAAEDVCAGGFEAMPGESHGNTRRHMLLSTLIAGR